MPIGPLSTLADNLRMGEGEVKELIEGFLKRRGFVEVTARGRVLSGRAGMN